jgi:ferredoxin
MAWVITRACADCIDVSCVLVCPVDCIYGLISPDPKYRNQLFIEPTECIDCALCAPVCPWEAIYHEASMPDVFADDVNVNQSVFADHPKSDFTTTPLPLTEHPSRNQIEANLHKWGFKRS